MNRHLHRKPNIAYFWKNYKRNYTIADKFPKKPIELPKQADVVIIGKLIECIFVLCRFIELWKHQSWNG